jgi:hypothetical protein
VAYNAFFDMEKNSTIRMRGTFPCWNLVPMSATLYEQHRNEDLPMWNAFNAFPPVSTADGTLVEPVDLSFDFGLQGCERANVYLDAAVIPSNSKVACHSTNNGDVIEECAAPYLDDNHLACEVNGGFNFHEVRRETQLPSCSLAVHNEQLMCRPNAVGEVCDSVNERFNCSDCFAVSENGSCQALEKVFTIGSRADATEIANYAFFEFGGTIKISGTFKSLTYIGLYLFSNRGFQPTEMNKESSIVFGRESLPVLVEIACVFISCSFCSSSDL